MVFYELSGGADFKPPQPPAQAPAARAAVDEKPIRTRRDAAPAIVRTATTQPATLVATAAVATVPAQGESGGPLNRVRANLGQGLTMTPDGTTAPGLTLASLELGASGLRTARPAAAPPAQPATAAYEPAPADLREVTGTRVNMRDGPGTTYPVIARLNIGHRVEVLSESGTGWLRLRTLPERRLGWIAASLISKPGR